MLCLKVKNVLALALVVRSRCEVLKASVKALVFNMWVVNNFNCRGFAPLLEDKLCLIFKLAPSVCRMPFPILASLLVRLVVLLPFQLLLLSLATPSRWTTLALSVFLHCVVALLLTLLWTFLLFMSLIVTFMVNSGLSSCSFFFQAEDGIRDGRVTGVQTCALPIFVLVEAAHRHRRRPEPDARRD